MHFAAYAFSQLAACASFFHLKRRAAVQPSDEDMAAAFRIADEDESGDVDVDEFLNLYWLMLRGDTKGLSSPSSALRASGGASAGGTLKEDPGLALAALSEKLLGQWAKHSLALLDRRRLCRTIRTRNKPFET